MRRVKRSRKMGERYMMFEQYMKEYVQEHADEIREEAREEGLAEGRAKGLEEGRAKKGKQKDVQKGKQKWPELNKLYASLLASGRSSDLQRALDSVRNIWEQLG